jgi:hypothetical protein
LVILGANLFVIIVLLGFWDEMGPHLSCSLRYPQAKHAAEFRLEASEWVKNPKLKLPVYKDVMTMNGKKYLPKKRYYVKET